MFSCCNYVISGERSIYTINAVVMFAFTSNISCNYTVENSYKDPKSHSPGVLPNRVNVGQLNPEVGQLETSVYFIITINFSLKVSNSGLLEVNLQESQLC